jgi:hypothetical protein
VAPVTTEDQLERMARCPTVPDSRRSLSPAASPPRPRPRRSACRWAPSCWASTTPSPNFSATLTRLSKQVGCESCRKARRRFQMSRSHIPPVVNHALRHPLRRHPLEGSAQHLYENVSSAGRWAHDGGVAVGGQRDGVALLGNRDGRECPSTAPPPALAAVGSNRPTKFDGAAL